MIEFVAANWVWIAAIVVFFALHRAGMGCGMHGSHHQEGRETPERDRPAREDTGTKH